MPHFYVSPKDIGGGRFVIQGHEAHHLQHVLKKKKGDRIRIFDGLNRSYAARIDSFDGDRITGSIIEESASPRTECRIDLYQGICRAPKMDLVIEKCTELGVSSITPVLCTRCVRKAEPGRKDPRHERWEKIARSASQQCGRYDVPEINPVVAFNDAVRQAGARRGLQLLPWEGEDRAGLKDILRSDTGKPDAVSIWIGPEGGFTVEEVRAAAARGIRTVSLGKRILRTETAGLVVAAIVCYELDLY